MIIEELLTLPPYLSVEGVHFGLQVFNNGGGEVRIGYVLKYVDSESPHKAQFDQTGNWYNTIADKDDPPLQSFLKLMEGIDSDATLIWAIRELWYWVHANQFAEIFQ